MTNSDRSNGSMPARHADAAPPPPAEQDDVAYDSQSFPSKKISLKLVWRALRRHWWQAMLLWAVGSTGLMMLAYYRVKPTYDAFSTIRIDPGDPGIFKERASNADTFEAFKETQVKLITSPTVVATALAAHPDLLHLPRLARAEDAEAEIRKLLGVLVVPKTNLIQVSMSSESSMEAAMIVNAVVEAYLKSALDSSEEENEKRVRRLREVRAERENDVKQKRDAIQGIQSRIGNVDQALVRERNTVTIEQYGVLTHQLLQTELQLVEAEAALAQLQGEPAGSGAGDENRRSEDEVVATFYASPQVAQLKANLDRAQEQANEAARIATNPRDPARVAAEKKVGNIQKQIDVLWTKMKPGLLQTGRVGPVSDHDQMVRSAELQANGLKTRHTQLTDKLEKLNIQNRSDGASALALEFAQKDLSRAEAVLDQVQKALDQLEFEAKNPVARFRQEYKAKPSSLPNTNNRYKVMAMAPLGMLFGVIGLLVLLELHAGRIVDPDELPARVHLNVIGVVPPLPQVRPASGLFSGRDEFRAQRQLDQFVQSLDHLRVAICSGRNSWGRERRCILITSACGSEGKTTLAAQLAERCVNAGLLTLLIDADLRNPTLSRMLDVPTNRGLINVLRGEAMAEEAMTVIGGAGGFHFLPAGTPKVDPSRLLHGDRLGKLLGQARESFDIVIVDAPPVLPVPDALTIGRWTDGAVLAVRYDTSRFPLVERANRRLASVNVPVIGAVVNGVRIAESTYGSYYPSYAYSNDRASQTPLDV